MTLEWEGTGMVRLPYVLVAMQLLASLACSPGGAEGEAPPWPQVTPAALDVTRQRKS